MNYDVMTHHNSTLPAHLSPGKCGGGGGGTNLEEGAWEGKVKEEGEARFRENECFSFRLYITVQDY